VLLLFYFYINFFFWGSLKNKQADMLSMLPYDKFDVIFAQLKSDVRSSFQQPLSFVQDQEYVSYSLFLILFLFLLLMRIYLI
jgi:hypothetical protein